MHRHMCMGCGDNRLSFTSGDNRFSHTCGDNRFSHTCGDNRFSHTCGDHRFTLHNVRVWLISSSAYLCSVVSTSPRLVCGRMPLWHYIQGCPFPAECGRNKTTPFAKSMTFSGATQDAAVEKCVYHLVNSSLHKMRRADAIDAARRMEFHTYDEATDDEAAENLDALAQRPRSPPRGVLRQPRSQPPPAPQPSDPSSKRIRLQLENDAQSSDQVSELEGDPLVKDISNQVSELVAKNLSNLSNLSSGSDADSKREARKCIADAEDAALKAQAIAQSAAQAFADVANKLNRAWHSMA
jgi:hypothetical protein